MTASRGPPSGLGISLIDLRLICAEDGDYANPIEPSALGGAKIARAIAVLVTQGHVEGTTAVIAAPPG
jgi:hypothetical protein